MKTFKKLFVTCATVAVAVIALSGSALAATGDATVTASALNMRDGAGTEYGVRTPPPGAALSPSTPTQATAGVWCSTMAATAICSPST